MLTFEKFSGINNVQPEHRLGDTDLAVALDVDIGLSGELSRRSGFTAVSDLCHKNLHQAQGYMLATVNGDLTAIHPDGARSVVAQSLGVERVWYADLPGGRTTFSNGLINGITDGLTGQDWSVPVPAGVGMLSVMAGALHPGKYAYYLTHVRQSDGLEGPPVMAPPTQISAGGAFLMGLPVLDGHRTNVYLSGHDGEGAYLAGSTATDAFMFGGPNNLLTLPCRTVGLSPAPVGTVSAFWRGRVLVAQGSTLWASMPHAPHLFDLRRDFKQFPSRITLVQPVDGGIYVGTDDDLIFLGGETFDQLTYTEKQLGPVVLGSGVSVPGDKIKLGDGRASGDAMVCIAGGYLVAGLGSGQAYPLTSERYKTSATEVSATFRVIDGIPQYIAVPQ